MGGAIAHPLIVRRFIEYLSITDPIVLYSDVQVAPWLRPLHIATYQGDGEMLPMSLTSCRLLVSDRPGGDPARGEMGPTFPSPLFGHI